MRGAKTATRGRPFELVCDVEIGFIVRLIHAKITSRLQHFMLLIRNIKRSNSAIFGPQSGTRLYISG